MEAGIVYLENVPLLVPIGLFLPFTTIKGCPNCCGAGEGIGNILVPENTLGLRISPACFIHDYDFKFAEPTWEAFHAANSRFLHNLISIVQVTSESSVLRHLRLYRCVTYYNAVDTVGNKVFWAMKREQQLGGFWSDYSPINDAVKTMNHITEKKNGK